MHPHDTTPEEWRPVPGWEDRYSVSNHGRVRSEHASRTTPAGWIRKARLDKGGYARVTLVRRPIMQAAAVHRLVAATFLGPAPEGAEVNHRDGDKLNNHADNLEYCTRLENAQHAARLGLTASGERHGLRLHPERAARGDRSTARRYRERLPRGEACHAAKLTAAAVTEIRTLHATGEWGYKKLSRRFGVRFEAIAKIVRRERWRHIP